LRSIPTPVRDVASIHKANRKTRQAFSCADCGDGALPTLLVPGWGNRCWMSLHGAPPVLPAKAGPPLAGECLGGHVIGKSRLCKASGVYLPEAIYRIPAAH
jgi:hypothetical protein